MTAKALDSLRTRKTLEVGGKKYIYYSLQEASKTLGDISHLPYSLKVLLENLLRYEDGVTVKIEDIKALAGWLKAQSSNHEIAYNPARVLMQDFTGVPAVVDLAAMREAMKSMGGDPSLINPLAPVDLVIDHSVMVDSFGRADSFKRNVELEFQRNQERYKFLKWGQKAFNNFRVVPPGTGICHQVNLEYLAQVVWTSSQNGETFAYPDTLVGTDSHTTMVNGLGVLGWGVGGIEAEAAMLGQPVSMLIPEVVGFRLEGQLLEGRTATDLVLTVTQMLREKGVVGKFVEFYGPGLAHLSLADRATIANMAPEYGATCGIFPIDQETLDYLAFTGRNRDRIALVEAYAKEQGLWRDAKVDPIFTDTVFLNLEDVDSSLAGPKRPQDKVKLDDVPASILSALMNDNKKSDPQKRYEVEEGEYTIGHGDVVIAAITSCTNTSNPAVMIGAGLLAKKAREKGLTRKPWVKTSLAPGSQVVTDYLKAAGLQKDLDALGFELVGYGCTTCIGNSGPLPLAIAQTIDYHELTVAAVLSGNRNFEGRIHPQVKLNYLASPPLVVAYALAGSTLVDLTVEPLGTDKDGKPVYLKDIWPSSLEIQSVMKSSLTPKMYADRYKNVFEGDTEWKSLSVEAGLTFNWEPKSTYVKNPPYFTNMAQTPTDPQDIKSARVLAILGDSVTTDHISPAGSIKKDSPAGLYLLSHDVQSVDFNSYGSRRGNHEVMMRGTFANIRLKNEMLHDITGGFTRNVLDDEILPIYDASMRYQEAGIPLVIIAGKEYGTGSSRDWAAKGTALLGVKAVIAESFERIHRSNLVGMGILPLVFTKGMTHRSLGLEGTETFDIQGVEAGITPKMILNCTITRKDGRKETIPLVCRIDTENEVSYYSHGGILPYVMRNLLKSGNSEKKRALA
ncbi:Aconitate hydratase AcnA [Candidatus Bealeia paramacronuclearis]|uniref:Aconitate hydratase n=1 Tax=Candidatus Bealeia paramacronuclearis TaxID=1921001 RepID=A0ABZ2C0H2_9PROT|nr:Aconitate hydratase AcnA [Candidatus Bealeia paramacronuclearis]